jgi:hypothetical protein
VSDLLGGLGENGNMAKEMGSEVEFLKNIKERNYDILLMNAFKCILMANKA